MSGRWLSCLPMALVIGGCAGFDSVAPAGPPLSSASDDFDRVVAALSDAVTADRRGSSARRRKAAQLLAATGAQPLPGSPDLVRQWQGRVSGPVYRDRLGGPGYRALDLAPRQTTRLEQTFLAGRTARVSAVTRQGEVSLSVDNDLGGARACPRTERPPALSCRWVPNATSAHRIVLANRSAQPAHVVLVVQ